MREAVCAFANDLSGHGKPGVAFIGASDNGNPAAGFSVTDELLRQLADIKTDGNIVPPPTLAATKLVVSEAEPRPTVLGLLVIGKSPSDWLPGAYTQFLRIAGTDLAAPIEDEDCFHGTIADQIRRVEEKLVAHNLRRVRFSDTVQEERTEAFPMDALRQLVRNALMHRSYQTTNAPVRVYWFDDPIEIHNPGGPFGSVTTENFGQPGLTDYRNPNLAEALRALGYVQRFGAGIAIAKRALGSRLLFEVQPSVVAAIIQGVSP